MASEYGGLHRAVVSSESVEYASLMYSTSHNACEGDAAAWCNRFSMRTAAVASPAVALQLPQANCNENRVSSMWPETY